MRDDELDRALAAEEEIVLSSGFLSAVMDAVRNEALTPPPIPFPWRRVLPGLTTCLAALAWLVIEGLRLPAHENSVPLLYRLESVVGPALRAAEAYGVNWILLAFLITLAAFKLSMRLASPGRF